jgi:hypothetical protein
MPVKRGDQAVWIGESPPQIVTVGTISPSSKTMLIKVGSLDYIVEKKEVLTMRQAANRGLDVARGPQEPVSDHEIHLAVQDDVHPY